MIRCLPHELGVRGDKAAGSEDIVGMGSADAFGGTHGDVALDVNAAFRVGVEVGFGYWCLGRLRPENCDWHFGCLCM